MSNPTRSRSRSRSRSPSARSPSPSPITGSIHPHHQQFATEWIAAFNSGDIDRIAKLYHENVRITTPKLIQVGISATGILQGKDAMIQYFTYAMSKAKVHFTLVAVLDGIDYRFTILYMNQNNQLVCDVMQLDPGTRTIIEYSAYYTQPQFTTAPGIIISNHTLNPPPHPSQHEIDEYWMKQAVRYAEQCISTKNAFNVGAILVDMGTIRDTEERTHESRYGRIVTTGFSREIEGNTHAEHVCLLKYSRYCQGNNPSHPDTVPPTCVLYTTMEPCSSRLSGNVSCVDHIIKRGVKRVVIGVLEPEIFVKECEGVTLLRAAGITVDVLTGFERLCLEPNRHVLGDEWQHWLRASASWDGTRPMSRSLQYDSNKLTPPHVSRILDVARPMEDDSAHTSHSHSHSHSHSSTSTSTSIATSTSASS